MAACVLDCGRGAVLEHWVNAQELARLSVSAPNLALRFSGAPRPNPSHLSLTDGHGPKASCSRTFDQYALPFRVYEFEATTIKLTFMALEARGK